MARPALWCADRAIAERSITTLFWLAAATCAVAAALLIIAFKDEPARAVTAVVANPVDVVEA